MLPLNFLEYALKGALFLNGGGSSFLSGRVPHMGGISFDKGTFEKNHGMGWHPLMEPTSPRPLPLYEN